MREDEVELLASINKDPTILDRIREQNTKLYTKLVHRMSSGVQPTQGQAPAKLQVKREDGV